MTFVVTIVTPEGSLRLNVRNAERIIVESGESVEGMVVDYVRKNQVVGEYRFTGVVPFLRKLDAIE